MITFEGCILALMIFLKFNQSKIKLLNMNNLLKKFDKKIIMQKDLICHRHNH